MIFLLFEGLEYTSHQHVLPHICSSKRKTRWRRWARWPHRGGGGEDFCEGPPASLVIPLPSLAPKRQRKLSASLLYSISGWRYLCPHNTFLGLESPIALALDRLPCSLMFLFDPSGARKCGDGGASVLRILELLYYRHMRPPSMGWKWGGTKHATCKKALGHNFLTKMRPQYYLNWVKQN